MDEEIVVERRHVKEDGFVIEEELGEEREVLSKKLEVHNEDKLGFGRGSKSTRLVFFAVNLENRALIFGVD